MADFEKKVTLIEVEIDQGAAIKEVDKLSDAIIEQKKVVKDNNEEIKDLNKTNQDLTKQVKAGTITQEEASKQTKRNSEKVTELTKKNLNLGDGIKDLNKERSNAVKVTKTQANSLDALRNKVVSQKKELNGLNTATKEGAKRFDELTKELKENNEKIKEADQAAGDYKTSIGDYAGQLSIVQKATALQTQAQGFLTAVTNSGTKATTFSSKALKVFKIALASTGVGLLVLALGSLISFLTSTQKGMDKVTAVTRPLQAIFERLKGVVQVLGEKVFNGLSKAVKNPTQALKDLGEIILNNIINRFKAFAVFGEALADILNGDLKKGLKGFADGAVQLTTGITDATSKIEGAGKAISGFVKGGIEAGTKLDQLTKQIEKAEISLITQRAELNKKFAESQEIAKDITKTEEERVIAAQSAIKAQNDLLAAEQNFLDLKIKRLEVDQTLNDTSREGEKEMAELIAERTSFEENAAKKRAGANAQLNSVKKQIASEEKKRIDEIAAKENEAREAKLAADEEAINKKKEQDAKLLENQRALNDKLRELDEFKREQQNERELEAAESEEEKFELMLEQQAERFELEQEVLAEQREIALENEALSNEEKLAVQADFDLQLEQLKQGNEDSLKSIDEAAKKDAANRQDKANKDELKKEQQTAKSKEAIRGQAMTTAKGATDAFFAVKNNQIDRQNSKETKDLLKQLGSGQITREEFDRKKSDLDKKSAMEAHRLQVKQFKANKAIAIVEGIINTAKGISNALGSFPPPASFIMAALVGVLGAAQIAVVASENPPPPPSFASGGDVFGFTVGGNHHSSGGTKYRGEDGNAFEVEKDEGIFVTKRSATNPALAMLSSINEQHGGRSMFNTPKQFLQEGGNAGGGQSLSVGDIGEIVAATVSEIPPQQVQVVDIMAGIQGNVEAEETGVV